LTFVNKIRQALIQWDKHLCPLPNQQPLSDELQLNIIGTQNECTFNANDGRHFIWTHDYQLLGKKGRGQGLHVSKLVIPISRRSKRRACEMWKRGGDIWWDGERLLEQIKMKAIPLFEAKFPGCKALCLPDNANRHCKYSDNA